MGTKRQTGQGRVDGDMVGTEEQAGQGRVDDKIRVCTEGQAAQGRVDDRHGEHGWTSRIGRNDEEIW